MPPEIQGGKRIVATDGGRRVVNRKRATPLGLLLCVDEQIIDHNGQADRGKAGWGGRNLAPYHGEVHLAGDGAGGQVRLWYRAASGRGGSRH